VLLVLAALLLLLIVGASGYRLLEGMNIVDALYMAVITLSTVGFGEVQELSHEGRLFTIILIIAGGGVVTYGLGMAGEFFFSGEWRVHLEHRRKQQMLEKLANHTIVCGYGRIGRYVVAELQARRLSFVIIERDAEKVECIEQEGYLAIRGDAADETHLHTAGIERAHSLVAATSSDAENVFMVLTARSVRPDLLIIAQANSDLSEPKLMRAGADRVILPFSISGRRIVTLLFYPDVADFLDEVMHAENIELLMDQVHITPTSPLAGQTLEEAHLRSRYGVTVLACRMPNEHLNTTLSAETVLQAGAKLIVMGTPEQLRAFSRVAGE
jgi:voltage-gated potassium channel